jgi:hypothetical protein
MVSQEWQKRKTRYARACEEEVDSQMIPQGLAGTELHVPELHK